MQRVLPPRLRISGKSPLYFWGVQRQIPGMRGAFSNTLILPLTAGAMLAIARTALGESALDAVRQIPKDQVGQIARIEARDGTPEPDRWYILTQDPKAENGVHEFVVEKGEVIASRSVSQFADKLTPEDVMGSDALKVDSAVAAKVAKAYADANGAAVASMNYELKKMGPDAAPAWTVSCENDKGEKLGTVVVSAGRGNVISHDGFSLHPEAEPTPGDTPPKREEPRFDTYAKPDVPVAAPGTSPPDEVETVDKAGHHHRRRVVKKQPSAIAKTLQNVGRTLEKFNPF